MSEKAASQFSFFTFAQSLLRAKTKKTFLKTKTNYSKVYCIWIPTVKKFFIKMFLQPFEFTTVSNWNKHRNHADDWNRQKFSSIFLIRVQSILWLGSATCEKKGKNWNCGFCTDWPLVDTTTYPFCTSIKMWRSVRGNSGLKSAKRSRCPTLFGRWRRQQWSSGLQFCDEEQFEPLSRATLFRVLFRVLKPLNRSHLVAWTT